MALYTQEGARAEPEISDAGWSPTCPCARGSSGTMGWRLYTVTDWCVEKMGPWTGRGAILFPDLDRHGHDLPAPGPLATGKAEPRHQVGKIPWCARRTLPANMRKRLFVRRVRRAHHVRGALPGRWGGGCTPSPIGALRRWGHGPGAAPSFSRTSTVTATTSPPPAHWQPAKRSPATRSAKSHGAHGAPYPRTCVSGCLYVGCAVRTMVDRPPGQRMWTSCFWAVSGRKGGRHSSL